MPTPKQPLEVPKEMPPQASNDHIAKRDRMIAELEKLAKDSSGTLQQVLRKMAAMMNGTKQMSPGSNAQAMQDVKDAFARYASDKETAAVPPPAILMEAVEWMQTYLAQRGFPVNQAGGSAPAGAPAPAASRPAAPARGGAKDGFDSRGATSHAQSIGGEAPLKPGAPAAKPGAPAEQAQQPQQSQQLDSMKETLKNWQLNSQLGKVKG